MFRHVNIETQCAIFAGTVFIIFFASSAFSFAKADPIDWSGDGDCSPKEMVRVYHPVSPGLSEENDSKIPSWGGSPYAGGPSGPGAPGAYGPNVNPHASLFGWWEPVAIFFRSILAWLGF